MSLNIYTPPEDEPKATSILGSINQGISSFKNFISRVFAKKEENKEITFDENESVQIIRGALGSKMDKKWGQRFDVELILDAFFRLRQKKGDQILKENTLDIIQAILIEAGRGDFIDSMQPDEHEEFLDYLSKKAIEQQAEIFDEAVVHNKANLQKRPGTFVHKQEKVGRNDQCPCGSGKKFKNCCMGKPSADAKESSGDQ